MKNSLPAVIGSDQSHYLKQARDQNYISLLNKSLRIFFANAVKISLKNPTLALSFLQTVRNQQKASRIRKAHAQAGLHVPPILIFSITNRCNLHCQGCYHQAIHKAGQPEMSEEKFKEVIAEARDLGISFIVLAGGEPLVRQDILGIIRTFPDIIFFMFTNGLLITDDLVNELKNLRNLVPILSIEGYQDETDVRRGQGVYARIQNAMVKLKKRDIFFGVSLTVTSTNFETITAGNFMQDIINAGCKMVFTVEYSPIKEGTEYWVISGDQRQKLAEIIENFRLQYKALFINLPGDEKDFGGCLSAGRGFVHINAAGDVEPCPFAPYSDTNLKEVSLETALKSTFLKRIRESPEVLEEGEGACALWTKRQWLQSMLKQ